MSVYSVGNVEVERIGFNEAIEIVWKGGID